ncbi:MAG: cytochrome c oxidase assembly protein [Dehalococcoidia bacterium]|nr:cytochrome c oxidase assembly protein [Dehalococcoidia bacterium]
MIALHTSGGSLSAWSFDPLVLTFVAVAGVLYASGIARSPGSKRRRHPGPRVAVYYGGLLVILAALVSPIDHIAGELFFVHMVQHFLLVIVAPPMLMLGAPFIPVLRGMPRDLRREVVGPLIRSAWVRRPLRFAAHPLVAWPLYVGTLLLWHVPPAYDAALRNEAVHLLEHAMFAGTALLWWWNVIDPVPLRPNLSYLARVPFVFLTTVPIFILGAFLTYSPRPWYRFYDGLTQAYGLTPLEDQEIGGVIMWIPGSLSLMATLLIVLLFVVRTEERQQRERETVEGEAATR